jgi:PHP family Zn ribbon phosphoesterase
MSDIKVGQRLECLRCHHTWNARIERKPVQCPKCKSPAWDLASTRLGETRARYEVVPKKRPRKKPEEPFDFMSLKSFGMWADMTETDEELLARLREGWEPDEERYR